MGAGNRRQETGDWKLEIGNRKQENQRQETGDRKPEAEKPETGNL
jgi:hypothetical protein